MAVRKIFRLSKTKMLPVLNWEEMSPTGSMDLLYADQFSADYYEDGIALITIGDADQFLLLPEGDVRA